MVFENVCVAIVCFIFSDSPSINSEDLLLLFSRDGQPFEFMVVCRTVSQISCEVMNLWRFSTKVETCYAPRKI